MNEQKTIDKMTDLELAELLSQQYETLMQTKQNLQVIQLELTKRKQPKQPD